jgi:hypothetical protein
MIVTCSPAQIASRIRLTVAGQEVIHVLIAATAAQPRRNEHQRTD